MTVLTAPQISAAGGEPVAEGDHRPLVGHCQVEALDPHDPQAVDRGLQLAFLYVEGEVAGVDSGALERKVIHLGGDAVGDRAAQQAVEGGVAGDFLFHGDLFSFFFCNHCTKEGAGCQIIK